MREGNSESLPNVDNSSEAIALTITSDWLSIMQSTYCMQTLFEKKKLLLFTKENRNFFKLFKKQGDKQACTNIDVYGQTYMYDAKAKYLQ